MNPDSAPSAVQAEIRSLPTVPILDRLPWLREVSAWSMPPAHPCADVRDSFLLGGGGYCSARLGPRQRVSTMERIMAPYLSSYNFGENANFRMSEIRPSRDFYPPFVFTPVAHRVWRVRSTAIVITSERDASYELTTVNAVHPVLNVFLRHATLRNISDRAIRDIGLSFDAPPDIPYPVAGQRSIILPISRSTLSERIEEMTPEERDFSQHYTEQTQRYRYMVRGVPGSRNRGYQDLFVHCASLGPGAVLEAVQYLTPALDDEEDSAIALAEILHARIEAEGSEQLFEEIGTWWRSDCVPESRYGSSEELYDDLIDANVVMQRSTERATGGWVVIDDYTGTWLRDHNGSYLQGLDTGDFESIRRSLDRYYALDRSSGALFSYYASDHEPLSPLPPEPDWARVEGFVTGDVPNFRALQHLWYFKHTGDLEYIRDRFDYLYGAFMRQRLNERGYMAEYCYDETYGIGPIGPMRTGHSADNTFNALGAAEALAYFARLLGRGEASELESYAQHIRAAADATFWLEEEGYYAMRLTPEGVLDSTPLSVGMLCPLWIGTARQNDPRAARSADYVYRHLFQSNGFLRLIPAHDQTVTMMIGYLIIALKRIGHRGLDRALTDLLKWADPSGTFGEYLDDCPTGPQQCYEHMAHRNRIWESGINVHALLFALTGYEPNVYESRLSLSPYLPDNWKHFDATNMRFGSGHVSISSRRDDAGLTHVIGDDLARSVETVVHLVSGDMRPISMNGLVQDAKWEATPFGMYRARLCVELGSGKPIMISY